MSKSARNILIAVLLAALAVFFALRDSTSSEAPRAPSAAAAPASEAPAPSSEPPAPRELDEPTARDAAPAQLEEAPATKQQPSSQAVQPVPDLAAREWITFHVENARGFPVAGADISLTGLRTKRERGSHYAWRGDPSLGKTGADGTLKLAYPVWVNLDDETGEISFTVAHPDYATYEDIGREVAPEIEVVLAMGSVLVVSGWIGEASHVITDVTPEFSWDVDVKPEDWLPRRDGRLTTTRVPQGNHLVYLRHENADDVLFLSDMVEFTLEAGETKELHLELKKPRQLTGTLDDIVPRPIVDGRVVLAVQLGAVDQRDALLRTFDVPVHADGTFEIGGIMTGDAQIIALCRGWASKMQPLVHDDLDDPDASGETELVAQIVDVRAGVDEFVVAMEPTAVLEVELHAPDGAPLAGAGVHAWPNACWRIGACGLFLDDRQWSAVTDEQGVARIDDIPAGEHNFGIEHADYALPLDPPGDANARRSRNLHFVAGATVRAVFTLERHSGD